MKDFKIWCETKEELDKVLQKMENESIVWYSGDLPTKWKGVLAPVALSVRKGKLVVLPFSEAEFNKYPDLITITPEEYLNERRTEMKLKDLKPGMVVEYASGERRLVVPYGTVDSEQLGLVGNNGSHNLLSYDNNLLDTQNKNLSINRVYKLDKLFAFPALLNRANLTLIWERKPEPKEMTMEELEAALGYPIKIVKDTR